MRSAKTLSIGMRPCGVRPGTPEAAVPKVLREVRVLPVAVEDVEEFHLYLR